MITYSDCALATTKCSRRLPKLVQFQLCSDPTKCAQRYAISTDQSKKSNS